MKEREIFLTKEEKELIAEKTGYSTFSIDQILRGRRPANKKHTVIFEMYNKLVFFRKMRDENYKKDLESLSDKKS